MSAPSCTPVPSSVKSVIAEVGQLAQRGEGGAGPAHRDGARHGDVGQRAPAEGEHLGRHPRRVDRRLGVGHGHDRGEAAERRGAGAGLDRLGLLAAGLAQVGVQVDEARADEAAGRRRGRGRRGAGRGTRRRPRRWRPRRRRRDGRGRRGRRPSRPGARAWRQATAATSPAPAAPRRAEGRGWPCARRRRSPPAG